MSYRDAPGASEARWSLSALLLAFVFCKLAGVTRIADWSWWAVLTPLWVPLLLAACAIGAYLVSERVIGWLEEREETKRRAQLEATRAPAPRGSYGGAKPTTGARLTVSTFLSRRPLETAVRVLATQELEVYDQPERERLVVRGPSLGEPLYLTYDAIRHRVDSTGGNEGAVLLDAVSHAIANRAASTTAMRVVDPPPPPHQPRA